MQNYQHVSNEEEQLIYEQILKERQQNQGQEEPQNEYAQEAINNRIQEQQQNFDPQNGDPQQFVDQVNMSQQQQQQESESFDQNQRSQLQQQMQMMQQQQNPDGVFSVQEHFPQTQFQQDNLSQDYKVNSPNRTSKQVLQRVFEGEFSVHQNSQSPQKNLNQIAANLSKININDSQQIYKQQQGEVSQQEEQQSERQDTQQNPEEVDIEFFDQCYKKFLSKIASDSGFCNATYEEKIAILIDYFNNDFLEFRLGALIFLFELIYNFRESLTDHAIALILTQIYQQIPNYYETKDFYNVYCALEIVALIGPHNLSFNNIKLLASILIDEAIPSLQQRAFLALVSLDYPGFYALLDIANKDFNDVPDFILNSLADIEEIQLSVIIPSLLNDINTGDAKKRIQSLAALNRMHSLIYKAGGLPVLMQLLQEGTLDRQLIVSTIRACGEVGEQTLLKIAKQTPNSKIKLAISNVLCWRVAKQMPSELKIKIVPYQVSLHYNVNPGTMCVYEGDLTPLAFLDTEMNDDFENMNTETDQMNYMQQSKKERQQDYISVNSRDFMAALQRLLSVKFEKFQNNQEQITKMHNIHQLGLVKKFSLAKLIDESLEKEEQERLQPEITANVIRGLCKLMLDENIQVREAAINALGLIGQPEAKMASEQLYKALFDKNSQIRAMAAWCCGRLGENQQVKVFKKLIDLLKDNYWKVRTASCVSIGAIGYNISELAFEPLTKILKDNAINKVTVCETLVRLGVYGEQILIDMLKSCPQTNFKLKSAIIQSFQLANVSRPSIDFIIEELFKNANDPMMQVRRSCLNTLEILRNRAFDSNITYLKSKNILPLFYFFLQDPCQEIRDMAMISIKNFGPQAELIFIEGLTKDKNSIIRCECAKGLAQMGIQNFRALLFGLRDIEENVRKVTGQQIKNYYALEEILEEYKTKENQVPALIVNIKDILSLPFIMNEKTRWILEQICIHYGEDVSQIVQTQKNNYMQMNQNQMLQQQSQQQTILNQSQSSELYTKPNQKSKKLDVLQERQLRAQQQMPQQNYVAYEPKNSFQQVQVDNNYNRQFEEASTLQNQANYPGQMEENLIQPDIIPGTTNEVV